MDPYETVGRHRPNTGRHFRKRTWLQKLLVRFRSKKEPLEGGATAIRTGSHDLNLGFIPVRPVSAGSPIIMIYPHDMPPEERNKRIQEYEARQSRMNDKAKQPIIWRSAPKDDNQP